MASLQGDGHIPEDLTVLTLNCWGLLHISALRTQRMTSIAHTLAALSPSVVCLQELFVQEDYKLLRRLTRQALPFGKYYHSGAFGSGLAILSKYPIVQSSTVPYPLNGRPTAFWRGDWYVGKGIACATLQIGDDEGDLVEVFNTHTHAPYEKGPKDSYVCHRTAQAWEMAKLVRGACEKGRLVIAAGDFNMLPLSLAHRLITSYAPVRDVWRVLHPDSSLGPSHHPAERARQRRTPTAKFNLEENGATSNNVYNTWRWNKNQRNKLKGGDVCHVDPETPDPRGQRLDYIFVSTGNTGASAGEGWVVKDAEVTMTDRVPDIHVSLSDHFAVQATLTYHASASRDKETATLSRPMTSTTTALHTGAYLAPPDSPTSSKAPSIRPDADYDAQLRYQHGQYDTLSMSVYDDILSLIRRYTDREKKQKYWRGVHFFGALAVWIGCLVAVWFSPQNFVAFILMLVSSLVLVAGTVDGLLSLLFFGSELRALREFEWEIRNAKAAASGDLWAFAEEEADDKDSWSSTR